MVFLYSQTYIVFFCLANQLIHCRPLSLKTIYHSVPYIMSCRIMSVLLKIVYGCNAADVDQLTVNLPKDRLFITCGKGVEDILIYFTEFSSPSQLYLEVLVPLHHFRENSIHR